MKWGGNAESLVSCRTEPSTFTSSSGSLDTHWCVTNPCLHMEYGLCFQSMLAVIVIIVFWDSSSPTTTHIREEKTLCLEEWVAYEVMTFSRPSNSILISFRILSPSYLPGSLTVFFALNMKCPSTPATSVLVWLWHFNIGCASKVVDGFWLRRLILLTLLDWEVSVWKVKQEFRWLCLYHFLWVMGYIHVCGLAPFCFSRCMHSLLSLSDHHTTKACWWNHKEKHLRASSGSWGTGIASSILAGWL